MHLKKLQQLNSGLVECKVAREHNKSDCNHNAEGYRIMSGNNRQVSKCALTFLPLLNQIFYVD